MKRCETTFCIMMLLLAVSAGCGKAGVGAPVPTATVQEIVQEVRDALGEEYVRLPVAMDEDMLPTLLGIDREQVEEFAGDFSRSMTCADSFIAIRAKAGYADEVRTALEHRRAEVERMFERYLPDPLKTAQAGKVLQQGDYVFLIMLGNTKEGPEKDVAQAEEIINSHFVRD